MALLELNITGLTKVSGNIYEVTFTSNFPLTSLKYQYSSDGAVWLGPFDLNDLQSPAQVVIPITGDFYLKMFDETTLTQTRKHNYKFNLKHN